MDTMCFDRNHSFNVTLNSVDLDEDGYQEGWKNCSCGSLRARLGHGGHLQFEMDSDGAGTTFGRIALVAMLEEE